MQQFGRYQVLDEIARGGMGVVYRALDTQTQQVVALKVLLRLDSEVARRRFQREAEALRRVDHPGVVRLVDHGLTPRGEPYMAMELVAGETLQARLVREGPLAVDDAVALTVQLCAAVASAHRAGVLHRDLKPDNVLAVGGGVKLMDFGIARDTEPGQSRTKLSRTGQFLGTPGYWAPEQAGGRLDQIGERTDVYGLGATLFALLTAQPPQQGETLADYFDALSKAPPAPSGLNPAVPAWLDRVVARALAPEPEERFPSVDALAEALEAGGPAGSRSLRGLALVFVALGALTAWTIAQAGGGPHPEAAIADPAPEVGESPPSADQSASAALERGLALARAEDFQAALEAFTEALRLRPDDAAAYNGRAHVHHRLGQFQAAVEDATEAIRLLPDEAVPYQNRGLARQELRDYAGAIEDFDAVIRLEPNAEAYAWRGAARTNLNDHVGACEDCTEAMRLDPDYELAYVYRAAARVKLGDLDGAVADCDEAIRLDPEHDTAYAYRGVARLQRGDNEGAVADLTEAIRRKPKAQSYLTRGAARQRLGDLRGAIEDYDEALRLEPEGPRADQVRSWRLDAAQQLAE